METFKLKDVWLWARMSNEFYAVATSRAIHCKDLNDSATPCIWMCSVNLLLYNVSAKTV
jgi:hypothetical protein